MTAIGYVVLVDMYVVFIQARRKMEVTFDLICGQHGTIIDMMQLQMKMSMMVRK